MEAGFFDLGSFGYTATVPSGTLGGDIRVKGLNLDLVGTLPLTDRLSALGRVGVTSARTTGSFSRHGGGRHALCQCQSQPARNELQGWRRA